MAVYTDFFVASPDEAAALDVAAGPVGLPTLRSRGVEYVKLSILDSILTGVPDRFPEEIAEDAGQESWEAALAEPLAAALASLTPEEVRSVSRQWSQTDELRMDRWTDEDTSQFLNGLRELASRARSERKRLYLWVSLSAPAYDRYAPPAQGGPAIG